MFALHVLLVLVGLECNYYVPTASMQPSLMVGDSFIAKSYRPYCRFGMASGKPIPRGAAILFRPPSGEPVIYIKRVVGVAGDRVALVGGHLVINGEPVHEADLGYFDDANAEGITNRAHRYRETLPSGPTYVVQQIDGFDKLDNIAEVTVPEGSYFVLGDNRDRSADSRVPLIGMVPNANIVAVVYKDLGEARNDYNSVLAALGVDPAVVKNFRAHQ